MSYGDPDYGDDGIFRRELEGAAEQEAAKRAEEDARQPPGVER